VRTFIQDQWAPLSHKTAAFGDGTQRPGGPSWVPPEETRRLSAYDVLAAYCNNVSRYYLPLDFTDPQIAKYREYGDAHRLVLAARSALLGDEQAIHVPGTEEDDVPEGQAQPPEVLRAQAAKAYLDSWAIAERLWLELLDAEYDTLRLGDGVWTLYWDAEKKRPRIVTYDPGFYFPVLESGNGDFPDKLHVAWEEKLPGAGKIEIHRLTWELARIRPALDPARDVGTLAYLYSNDGTPVLMDGDTYSPATGIQRQYPWNVDEKGEPVRSGVTCFFTHAVFDASKTKGTLIDFTEPIRYERGAHKRDLRLDFLPAVHVPNTPARREHFGQSLLLHPAQGLDDLNGTHSDLAESGALVGNATLVTKGAPGDLELGQPGSHLNLPDGGDARYLDVSKNLDALLKLEDRQRAIVSENSRISPATLGRTDGANSVSGLALALSFSPTSELVRELRMVRNAKYPLLLRMVLRMAQAAKQLDPGATPPAEIVWGSFLPADKQQAVTLVSAAIKGRAMSTHTGVLYLQAQGFPIDDAVAEVTRIQKENMEAAKLLWDATGDETAVATYLGIDLSGAPTRTNPPAPPA
jgi:hypothetical protein